ncbi:MAG: hypothetical protein LBF19_01310 [Prevotellaceae bacterium]|jgi:hypothetical protein|nr:hypothetical protein [Prevotellaceae bacterium]
MKTTPFLTATLLLICVCLACACKDEERPIMMPPETQEGKNTFGCYVNGELYSSDRLRWLMFTTPPLEATYYQDYVIVISCSSISDNDVDKGTYTYFHIALADPKENVEMKLERATVARKSNNTPSSVGFEDRNIDKIILTRFDTINRIVSGRFSFTLPAVSGTGNAGDYFTFNSDSTARVTDGRFDLELRLISQN